MKKTRLLFTDVDGVLTDGRLLMFSRGSEAKFFHVQDGLGIKRAIEQGVKVGMISGRESSVVRRRAKELGVEIVVQGCADKVSEVRRISDQLDIELDEIAYIGDDLNDLGVMKIVGRPIAVANAVAEVRNASVMTTKRNGGDGAVREAIEWLLSSAETLSFSIAIPARLQSTRLPRKVLTDICGRPMLRHVFEAARSVEAAQDVVILTDSGEVASAAEGWGARVILTPADCASGTERIATAIDQLEGDLIVNLQADQPFLTGELIGDLVTRSIESWEGSDVFTPVFKIENVHDLTDEGIVKVVKDGSGRAVYFSRATVPFLRDQPVERWLDNATYWGHQGIYLFRRQVLETFFKMQPGALEDVEKLEQLRFMENGLTIQTLEIDAPSFSVDLPEHLDAARVQMAANGVTYA